MYQHMASAAFFRSSHAVITIPIRTAIHLHLRRGQKKHQQYTINDLTSMFPPIPFLPPFLSLLPSSHTHYHQVKNPSSTLLLLAPLTSA